MSSEAAKKESSHYGWRTYCTLMRMCSLSKENKCVPGGSTSLEAERNKLLHNTLRVMATTQSVAQRVFLECVLF